MGFLKFLKKKEGTALPDEELDLPPTPPAFGGEDLGLKSLGEEFPTIPELSELPPLEDKPEEMLEIPKFEDVAQKPSVPERPVPAFKPEEFIEKVKKATVSEKVHTHKEVVKPIFLKLSRYKQVLNEIEMVKYGLNNLERVSSKLSDLKEEKDKKFARWNEHFKDVQKKLGFIDKTLFAR